MRRLRLFLLVLSLIILSAFSVLQAYAGSAPKDVSGTKFQQAVEQLLDKGVVSGYADGTYRPYNEVTRAEMTAFLSRLVGLDAASRIGNNVFSDVSDSHWAKGYIAAIYDAGIVKGKTENNFDPEGKVTYAEACAMVVRTLGYGEDSVIGSWPQNYISKATELSILDSVAITDDGSHRANRGDVALMLASIMEAISDDTNIDFAQCRLYSGNSNVQTTTFDRYTNEYIRAELSLKYEMITEDTPIVLQCEIRNANQYYIIYQKSCSTVLRKDTSASTISIALSTDDLMRWNYDIDDYRIIIKYGQKGLINKEISLYVDYSDMMGFLETTTTKMFGAMWDTAENNDWSNGEYYETLYSNTINEMVRSKLTLSYEELIADYYIPIHIIWYHKGAEFLDCGDVWQYFEEGSTEHSIFSGIYYMQKRGTNFPAGVYTITYGIGDQVFNTQKFKVIE